jgi:AmiR/NasT family two-component response regulator
MTAAAHLTPEQETEVFETMLGSLRRENDQLRTALVTRIVIEQAKGVLSERLQMEVDEAFERLRRESRNRRMRLHTLAAAVVACEPWTKTIFSPGAERDPR